MLRWGEVIFTPVLKKYVFFNSVCRIEKRCSLFMQPFPKTKMHYMYSMNVMKTSVKKNRLRNSYLILYVF